MNEHDQGTELGAALQREVSGLHDTPFTLADVQGRARGIRRRRHALAAAAAAAVVAVAVPSVLLLGGTTERTSAPDPAGPSQPATEAAEPATAPASSVLRGDSLTRPDGTTTELELPGDAVLEYAVLGDGRVVAVTNGGRDVLVLGADGRAEATHPAEINHIVAGGAGDTVAWVGDDGAVRVLEAGTPEPTVLATPPPVGREGFRMVDAVLGSDCAAGGCSVLTGDGNTTTHRVTRDGAREIDLGEPLRVLDFSPDRTMFAYAEPPGPNQQYGCVGLRDAASATTIARSCEVWGLSFSPDGRHVQAAFAENNMLGDLRVLDLSLQTVLTYEPAQGRVVSRTGWASPDSLLVSVAGLSDNRWSLLEVPIDGGDPTTVEGPVDGDNPEVGSEFLPSL